MPTTSADTIRMRPITPADNNAIAQVIRRVSAESGLTADKGYTVSDPNLDHLYELYSQPRSAYWVIKLHGQLAGGGGVGAGAARADVCHITGPMGNTDHVDCEVTMLKTL